MSGARTVRVVRFVWVAMLACASRAEAAGPLGPQSTRIQTSAYNIDLFQGPVLASTRITGLAGAYTAIAEGADGIPFNPAAASLRPGYSTTRDDWDLTAGLTLPNSVTRTDFDNNGKIGFSYDKFFWLTGGGYLQHDQLGLGLIASFQNYSLGAPGEAVPLPGGPSEVVNDIIIRIAKVDAVVSYGFFGGQLHIGAGARVGAFYTVGSTEQSTTGLSTSERLLLNSNVAGLQAGALWAPYDLPIRIGGAARSPVTPISGDVGRIKPNADGDSVIGNLYLPTNLKFPWEVEGGFAIQLWKRPLNIKWTDEDTVPAPETERWRQTVNGMTESTSRGARHLLRARYRQIPREKVLLSASALVSGAVPNAVGLESMLSQTVDRSGEKATVTLRAGAEAEIVPLWLTLRGGSYLEPTRFEESSSRLHGTAGMTFRVLQSSVFGLYDEGTVFGVSLAGDIARDYFGWSIGAGLYR